MKYKKKANGSLASAQRLINSDKKDADVLYYYTASVHCSYYAVLLYMKYMLAHTDRQPIGYDEQKSDSQSSHEYLLAEIRNRITNHTNAMEFGHSLRALKRSRIDADYKKKLFTLEESLECKQHAESLISSLKQYFGNI